MIDLGTLGGGNSIAYAINNLCQVVGHADTVEDEDLHAFLYRNGQTIDLDTMGNEQGVARGINHHDQVVGHFRNFPAPDRAFLWDQGTMYDLNDLIPPASGWTLGLAGDINNAGWIVG